MKQSLVLTTLVVADYDDAIDFYVNKLGFDLVEDTHLPEEQKRWVVIAPPGAIESRLLLACATGEEQSSRVGNQTGGLSGTERKPLAVEESYGTVAVFADLYGNLWDLVQPNDSA